MEHNDHLPPGYCLLHCLRIANAPSLYYNDHSFAYCGNVWFTPIIRNASFFEEHIAKRHQDNLSKMGYKTDIIPQVVKEERRRRGVKEN